MPGEGIRVAVEIVDTLPSLLTACGAGSCSVDRILEGYVSPNSSVLASYISEHLGGHAERLAEMISRALSLYPSLLARIAGGVLPRINVDRVRTGIERGMQALSRLLGRATSRLRVVLMVTGFDSALSAYGENIYVGLEWFIDPNDLGLPRDDPLYPVLSWLSRDPTGFIESNTLHELVHILTPGVSGDPVLARVLEEGRATYISWLAGVPKERLFPLIYHSLSGYASCLPRMLQALREHVAGRLGLLEDELFSIHKRDRVCGLRLMGYYLGFYLAQILHDYYNGDLARLARLQKTDDLEKLLSR